MKPTYSTGTGIRVWVYPAGFVLRASPRGTEHWANTTDAKWPCSTIAGRRLYIEFDTTGLVDLSINSAGPDSGPPIDGWELNAFIADAVLPCLPTNHPCRDYFLRQ